MSYLEQNKNYQNELDTKLTKQEIASSKTYQQLPAEEQDQLIEFVYNLSLLLYKSFTNEQARLL
jgi:hypothetical protein